jgi:hypothetical protein
MITNYAQSYHHHHYQHRHVEKSHAATRASAAAERDTLLQLFTEEQHATR